MTKTFTAKEWNALPTAKVLAWIADANVQLGREGRFFTATFH